MRIDMIVNTFKGKTKYNYAAFDFETRMYVDGVVLPEEEIFRMCGEMDGDTPKYPQSWWREHCRVECWAWIVYTPDGFAIAETFDEWLSVVTKAHLYCGWFYNAPFDFSILDYEMLSRGWEYVPDMKLVKSEKQFGELSSDYGARYTLTVCAPYEREKGDRSKRKTWRFRMHDLRNILHGGLKQLLKDFDVRDADGNEIRKLEMDYQSADGSEQGDIEYMLNDAAGLWWLIDKCGGIMKAMYNLDIRGKKPDVLTASGLSKRVFLNGMYPDGGAYWYPRWKYRKEHPITLEQDDTYRQHGLLAGGLVIVNPRYAKRHLSGITLNRYDVNSEYPAYMIGMRSICGYPAEYRTLSDAMEWHDPKESQFIYAFSRINAVIKEGALACWRHPFTHEICDEFSHYPPAKSIFIFHEEFEELLLWYDIYDIELERVIVYPTRVEKPLHDLIRTAYEGKTDAKVRGDKAVGEFHKLFMNGLSGKFSQNPNHGQHLRVINADGFVSFVETGVDQDENSLMQVVQGARITAAGRIMLRQYARMACGGVEHTAEKWLYADTDSIHVLAEAPEDVVDKIRIGALKKENKAPITRACFLAPKSYYEIEDGIDPKPGEYASLHESGRLAIHAKGVNTLAIIRDLDSGRSLQEIYSPGSVIQSLSALNVPGGKALLPLQKRLLRDTGENDETYH